MKVRLKSKTFRQCLEMKVKTKQGIQNLITNKGTDPLETDFMKKRENKELQKLIEDSKEEVKSTNIEKGKNILYSI